MNSNPQLKKFQLVQGARGYKTRSDPTATARGYLVGGSQNVLINEATDEGGDKVETRPGYEMKGSESSDREGANSEFVFKTKNGQFRLLRFTKGGDLQLYIDDDEDWYDLKTSLQGDYPCRFATWWNASELLRLLLFVNHDNSIYEWSGAMSTLPNGDADVAAGTVDIAATVAASGFLTTGTRSIRIRDSGGTWRETVYTAQSGSQFTVSSDLSAFTFAAGAPVVQVVRTNATEPAAGVINDVIKTLDNHVYVGSHSSAVVYMSKSGDFTDFAFSSPRLATDGWQFVLDSEMIGFETNIASGGEESMVFFAGSDWMYRVEFVDIADSSISQIAKIRPIIVSSGQGAVSQELISKVKNSIVYLNAFNELLEFGSVENIATVQQTPISDPIKPDFLAADFTGGAIRFWRNNLYITAAASGRMFILSFRGAQGMTRFWQPPQLLPVGPMSDYDGYLIGHSSAQRESYTLFLGTNDNAKPIAFKAHFAYENYAAREKAKEFIKYFVEMYLTSNTTVTHSMIYEYLGAKTIRSAQYTGSDADFLFTPNPSAALGVNSLGTSPLGAPISGVTNYLKYRRFKKVTPVDFFEFQSRFEADELDAQFQILCHGPEVGVSKNAPAKITS